MYQLVSTVELWQTSFSCDSLKDVLKTAMMAAPSLIPSDWSNLQGISYNSPRAVFHYMPFSHALIAALQLIAFG